MIVLIMSIIFSGGIYVDSADCARFLRPGVSLLRDSGGGPRPDVMAGRNTHNKQQNIAYALSLIGDNRISNAAISVSLPSVSLRRGISWSGNIAPTLSSDTSHVLSRYEGVVADRGNATIHSGRTVYVQTSTIVTGTVTTSSTTYAAFASGLDIQLSPFVDDDTARIVVAVTQSTPTNNNTPPDLQTSNVSTVVNMPVSGGTVMLTGLKQYIWRRNWWLLGLSRTLETYDIALKLDINISAFGQMTAAKSDSLDRGRVSPARSVP